MREWLDTLGRFNVPCALVSALDRQTVQVCRAASARAMLEHQDSKAALANCCVLLAVLQLSHMQLCRPEPRSCLLIFLRQCITWVLDPACVSSSC